VEGKDYPSLLGDGGTSNVMGGDRVGTKEVGWEKCMREVERNRVCIEENEWK